MPDFVIFKKGKQIAALEKSDADGAVHLIEQGYEKQFEEIDVPSAEQALSRFADIKNDEATTEYAFATGAAFIAFIVVLMAIGDLIFLKQ